MNCSRVLLEFEFEFEFEFELTVARAQYTNSRAYTGTAPTALGFSPA